MAIYVFTVLVCLISGCKKDDIQFEDNDNSIFISESIIIDNRIKIHDPNTNLVEYNKFLKYLVSSDRFVIVPQKDFDKTFSDDKVVISLRHDVDDDINASIKMAYMEHKYGIVSTYYILHTAKYYGITKTAYFKRSDKIIYYLKKLQDSFGHEVGIHNDLVTLQVIYSLDPKAFLHDQLDWLRENGIHVSGTSAHGSNFCHFYHYSNTYFWRSSPYEGSNYSNFEIIKNQPTLPPVGIEIEDGINKENNFEEVRISNQNMSDLSERVTGQHANIIKIIKDDKENYGLSYDANFLKDNYYFSDASINSSGKRWHMGMQNFNQIAPGQKVIILIHPQHWD
jgi:hypothetical protein